MRSPFSMTLDFSHFNSLFSLVRHFNSNDVCKTFLAEARWGEDVVCPYCGEHHCSRCKDGRFNCKKCDRKFNVTVGTIFENSKIGLDKWFMGIYLVSSHKSGISSCQLARDIEVTQKSAWFMLNKIRSTFGQNDNVALVGNVEVDEAYVGGDNKWRHESKKLSGGQGGANKTPIFGMICRENGNVVALKVEDTKSKTILPLISQFVSGDDTIVYTDESSIYNNLYSSCGFPRKACNHGNGEFSDGNGVHTNNIENFWHHFKAMIKGIYRHISVDYMQRYVDEECFRWNSRDWNEGERFKFVFNSCIGKFTYEDVKLTRKVA